MAHPSVLDTVRSHLAAEWTECPLRLPNEANPELDESGDPFVSVQFPFAESTRISVNEPLYREDGGVRFVFAMVAGEGLDRPLAWSRDISALFEDETIGPVNFG